MTEQPPKPIGTVAQEAARLIEDMAAMVRLGYVSGDEGSPYAGESAHEHVSPTMRDSTGPARSHAPEDFGSEDFGSEGSGSQDHGSPGHRSAGFQESGQRSAHLCSECGAERRDNRGEGLPGAQIPHAGAPGDDTSQNCRLCPLCRGVAVLRSVRPETVELLADLAVSVAASLREAAMRSRASEPPSSARSNPGAPTDAGRAPVQDIPVDDENEG